MFTSKGDFSFASQSIVILRNSTNLHECILMWHLRNTMIYCILLDYFITRSIHFMKLQRIARCMLLSLILDIEMFQFVWNINGTQSLYAVRIIF